MKVFSSHVRRFCRTFILVSMVFLFFLYYWAAFSLTDVIWGEDPFPETVAISNYQGNGYLINTSECKIPNFGPWDKDVLKTKLKCHWREELPPRCGERQNRWWMYTNGTHLIFNYTAIHDSGYSMRSLRCCYRKIIRIEQPPNNITWNADDLVKYSDDCFPIPREHSCHKPEGEFLRVQCMSNEWPLFEDVVYREFFTVPIPDAHASQKISSWKSKTMDYTDKPPNVVIIMLDTNSRLNSHRRLSKTLNLLEDMGAVEMLGYTKTGSNTFPNTIPFMAGMKSDQFVRNCIENPELPYTFDGCQLLWKDFDHAGYLTATCEDSPGSTSFNFYKGGFRQKPTDFYYRTFTLMAMDRYKWPWEHHWFGRCIGGIHSAKMLLNYIQHILKHSSQGCPVFVHSVLNVYSHECINAVRFEDSEIAEFVEEMDKENTILFLMGDHGDRHGAFRDTTLGWYEDRLPAMFVYLPQRVKLKFPHWNKSLKINSRRLTSHFDLYWTLVHILESYLNPFKVKTPPTIGLPKVGQSLLEPLQENRTCEQAGIPISCCACTRPEVANLTGASENNKYWAAARVAVDLIAKSLPLQCAQPVLKKLVSARVINYSTTITSYIVKFTTDPGEFMYEATVKAEGKNDNPKLSIGGLQDISRISTMTKRVVCIRDSILELYCYCLQ